MAMTATATIMYVIVESGWLVVLSGVAAGVEVGLVLEFGNTSIDMLFRRIGIKAGNNGQDEKQNHDNGKYLSHSTFSLFMNFFHYRFVRYPILGGLFQLFFEILSFTDSF